MPLSYQGIHAEFLADQSAEICMEGGLSSGKTTVALWKVRQSCKNEPGIHWFICRYSDADTQQKLKPAFETICNQFDPDDVPAWDSREKSYKFENGSKVFAFGLKAPDAISRYSKLRGMGVAKAYVDQAEELLRDISLELRARLRQPGFPHQLLLTPNPMDDESWIAQQFPDDNSDPLRKYYSVSLYDNAHNLTPDLIASLEKAYPVEHAKHRTMILGKRGVNVTGDPVYEGSFKRTIHQREIPIDFALPIYVAITCGKSHPTAIAMQQPFAGGMSCLAGLLGVSLFLDDFLPVLFQQLERWFGAHAEIRLCTDGASAAGDRYTLTQIIREKKLRCVQRDYSNAPDVRLAMIERLAAYMRKRNPDGNEAFGIEKGPAKWLRLTRDGLAPKDFLADALEAGYVWSEHTVSVANKDIRQPLADNRHEHAGFCLELLEQNFGLQLTQAQRKTANERRSEMAYTPFTTTTGDMAWAR